MADDSEVDAALTAKLLNDATLMALLPDGVFFDVATQLNASVATGPTRFVIISAQAHEEEVMLIDQTAYERFEYVVKAVTAGASRTAVKAAASRIRTLLNHGTLTITGYSLMSMRRRERIFYTELDEDKDLRWQHMGGVYELLVSPL